MSAPRVADTNHHIAGYRGRNSKDSSAERATKLVQARIRNAADRSWASRGTGCCNREMIFRTETTMTASLRFFLHPEIGQFSPHFGRCPHCLRSCH